jgi:hypothetical protein
MRWLLLLSLLATGCITGSRARERDDRLLREISRQERWAQEAVEARATPDELARIRQRDYEAVGAGRKKLRKLITGIDRGTWVREAVVEAARDGEDDPALLRAFDRAGQLRRDAAAGADELADALAEAPGALAIADLQSGFEALRKAQRADGRLPGTAQRLKLQFQPAPLPTPRPLVTAAARVLRTHPEQQKDVDRLPGEDAVQIRSQLAQLELSHASDKRPEPRQEEETPAPAAPAKDVQADAPPDLLRMEGDVKETLSRRGLPREIVLRPDGLFGLRYDDGELTFDGNGRRIEPGQR